MRSAARLGLLVGLAGAATWAGVAERRPAVRGPSLVNGRDWSDPPPPSDLGPTSRRVQVRLDAQGRIGVRMLGWTGVAEQPVVRGDGRGWDDLTWGIEAPRLVQRAFRAPAAAEAQADPSALASVLIDAEPSVPWWLAVLVLETASSRPTEVETFWFRAPHDGSWTRLRLPRDSCVNKGMAMEPGVEVELRIGLEQDARGAGDAVSVWLSQQPAAVCVNPEVPLVVRQEEDLGGRPEGERGAQAPGDAGHSPRGVLRLPLRGVEAEVEEAWAGVRRAVRAAVAGDRAWVATLRPDEARRRGLRYGDMSRLLRLLDQEGARFTFLHGGWRGPIQERR